VDGVYRVSVGSSSRDIRATAPLRVPLTFGAQSVELSTAALATPGGTLTVTGTVRNTGDLPLVGANVALSAPAGWSGAGSQPVPSVRPRGTAQVSWHVRVPADAAAGSAQLTATARWTGGARQSATGTATVKIPYASLAAAFNGTGISDDANPAAGNFDGSGYSFSAQALAKVGVTPGASVAYNGLTYHWPSGAPDMVTAAGQVISLAGSGSTLGLLGSANNGTASGPVTVTYTDGTTSSGTVTFADWYGNAAVPGCSLAVTTANWNQPPNGIGPHAVSLYTSTVALTPGKQAAAVTLPAESRLHIFAAALG
jgi:beta-glucosidase